MTKQEITDKIIEIIFKNFKIEKEEISLESTFQSLGVDSLDVVEFIFDIEIEFKLIIPDNVLLEFVTVASVVDYVDKLKNKE